ncbi:MAG: TauD/TfdA family dioxygenase [Alphaproteobacteria bacterium]|nr:TauD/TfdA family dioxygenase [Alphaproteobacteria bacterium]
MIDMVTDHLDGPDVWLGRNLQLVDDWIIHLDDSDIAEIDGALNVAMSRGVQVPFATADFPLDHLRARLAHLRDMVCHGYGVALLRGLPRDRYTTEECELIYWGIGAHLGRSISQSLRGDLIGYVQDEGGVMDDANVRGYKTAGALQFHCDQLPADILGLFCVNDARMGGESHIVSALAMHNVIRAERPDLLPHLYEPINVDWRGDEPDGQKPWYQVPMFSVASGKITSRFTNRFFVRSTTRHGEELAPSPTQWAALEFAHSVAERPEMRLSMTFESGDMQFINNHTTLHGRSPFEDWDEPARKRLLLRLWIALEDDVRRPLSPLLDERYHWVTIGGIPRRATA